jgi:PAS domain S-box-containing protein
MQPIVRDEARAENGYPPGDTERRYRTLAESMPQMVWATDASGAHVYFNRRWYEYTGMSEAESLGFGFANALHPDDRARTLERWRQAWQDGAGYEIEYRFRRHDGAYRWFVGRANPVRDAEGRAVEWVGTCTDINAQRQSAEAQHFIAKASALLASSLNYEVTLANVANLAVPHIADWCAIDILEDDGSLRRLAVAHVDPAKVSLAHRLQVQYPVDMSAPSGVPAVLRTGQPEVIAEISDELLIEALRDAPELLGIFRDLGLRSSMVVPLVARERTLGAITLVSAESGRLFGDVDLALATDLARRAATAVDNARLYRELSQFKATLDQTRDCVFMFDPETLVFFYVNQGAIDQVGYSRDELLHMTPIDIKPEFSEASYRAMIAPLLDRRASAHTFETFHRRKDGSDVPVEVMLQVVKLHDGTERFVTIVRDISERRRAEERLRASQQRYRGLAEAMPQVVWTTTADGTTDYYNQRWFDYTGLRHEPSDATIWQTVIHPDDLQPCIEAWQRSLERQMPFELEYRWRRHDGEYRWHLGRALPVRDHEGNVALWVGTGTDIHDQKQAEVALRERAEELANMTTLLEQRNRELDQFAYITSHDLKAPLRGIANLSQWIEEDLGDHATDEVRHQMELLRGRVHRMEALIDGILQYSRVGRVRGAIDQVVVGDLLHDVIDLLDPPAPFSVSVAPNMPAIMADKVLLSQVFSNLIGNAFKHHNRPDGQVWVDWRDAGPLVEFTVRDDGPGIAKQYHERAFAIFQTLAPRDRVEGSGLGLSLVKKIVESEGGTVTLDSEEGKGATFRFTWPKRPKGR